MNATYIEDLSQGTLADQKSQKGVRSSFADFEGRWAPSHQVRNGIRHSFPSKRHYIFKPYGDRLMIQQVVHPKDLIVTSYLVSHRNKEHCPAIKQVNLTSGNSFRFPSGAEMVVTNGILFDGLNGSGYFYKKISE